uniref:Uncharacterized protein n=1 Tax=Arundo donax TaxID=35708 RepID=A0A0A8ZY44_ARUDO
MPSRRRCPPRLTRRPRR